MEVMHWLIARADVGLPSVAPSFDMGFRTKFTSPVNDDTMPLDEASDVSYEDVVLSS